MTSRRPGPRIPAAIIIAACVVAAAWLLAMAIGATRGEVRTFICTSEE